MESLTITHANKLANNVSVRAIAASKVAGVRVRTTARSLRTPSMVNKI